MDVLLVEVPRTAVSVVFGWLIVVVIDPDVPRVTFAEVIPIGAEWNVVPVLLVEAAELVCKLELDVSGTTVTVESDVCLEVEEDVGIDPEVPEVSFAEVLPIGVEWIVVLFVLVALVGLVCKLNGDVWGFIDEVEGDVCLEVEEDVVIDPGIPDVGTEWIVVPLVIVVLSELVCTPDVRFWEVIVRDDCGVCLEDWEDASEVGKTGVVGKLVEGVGVLDSLVLCEDDNVEYCVDCALVSDKYVEE